MQKQLIILLISIQFPFLLSSQQIGQKAFNIIEKIDKNMFSKTQIVTSEMIVYGKRKKRVISFLSNHRLRLYNHFYSFDKKHMLDLVKHQIHPPLDLL